jgi:hypothetical protein
MFRVRILGVCACDSQTAPFPHCIYTLQRAFKSMLRTGLITDIFDPMCLASPPDEVRPAALPTLTDLSMRVLSVPRIATADTGRGAVSEPAIQVDTALSGRPFLQVQDYKIEDPKKPGTFVDIPRPVSEIRVWDPATRGYSNVETRMEGAPPPGTEDKYWETLLVELRAFHGVDVVDDALEGK